MMAFVRWVMPASTKSESMQYVSGRTSTMTGRAPALSTPYWQSTLAAHHAMVNKNASVRGGGNTAWSNVELDLVRAPGVLRANSSTPLSGPHEGALWRHPPLSVVL